MIDPHHLDLLTTLPHHAGTIISSSSSSSIISSSLDAVLDVTTPSDASWWDNWLNLFRQTLLFVHDDIVSPAVSKVNPGFTQTWGVSIAVFTIFVRSALIPLSVQQTASTERMKALKPYQDEIKEKFKDNKDMQNRALSKLFEDSNTNPLAGCLVSLLQLPIFLALYRSVTFLAREGNLDEPFLWIPSLEGPVSAANDYRGMEWLTQGWVHSSDSLFGWEPALGYAALIPFLIMPVVLVIQQSFTMSVLAPPVDENQSEKEKEDFEKSQRVLKFLPLMIGYFSLQVPAGLTIYWFCSNTFTLLQSVTVKQYYKANPPDIELPEYWDALDSAEEMSIEQKKEAAAMGLATGPKFEDLVDAARVHYSIHRTPLREGSEAGERCKSVTNIGPESAFAKWVVE